MELALMSLKNYMGTGFVILIFVVCLFYLFLKEKRKTYRIMFIYGPVFILAVFILPVTAKLMESLSEESIYWRLLWLLPVTVVISYCSVKLLMETKGKMRIAVGGALAVLFMVSGRFMYFNENVSLAENIYHVPESVRQICDAIEYPGREVMAVFPEELITFVRQYSGQVCMPYGREIFTTDYYIQNDLKQAMAAEVIDAGELCRLSWEKDVVYIILDSEKEIQGSMEENEYDIYGTYEGYDVYRRRNVDLENWYAVH
ncbi:MAG: hypothetical protein K6D96_10580 [Acetatifactor sp.]|nr:hypothetical protein [Acetatifactor sp.]